MPHHPGTGCEIEEAVFGTDVAVQDVLFFVLDEGAEGGVYYAFWFARGAGAVKDVDWVAGWEGGEDHGGGFVTRKEVN